MPNTYYVRKTGSDAAAGTSAGAAWLTVDKAANTVAAGDVVWLGAGVYRETVTIDTSGTNGSEIEWRADIDGAMTGDAGLVVITRLADETGTGGTGHVLDLNGKEYNEFYDIVFAHGGNGTTDYTLSAVGNTTYQGTLFDTCTFLQPVDTGNQCIYIDYGTGGTIAGNKPAFRNCKIHGIVLIAYGVFTADAACGWVIENCVIDGVVNIDGPNTAGSFGPSGYEITNNKFPLYSGVILNISDQYNTGATGTINNNVFLGNTSPISITGDGGTWTANNNKSIYESNSYPTGSNNASSCGFIFGADVEHIYRKHFGWSPFAAHEPVWDRNGSGYKSGGIDAGSATYAPATDMYGNPRPMGAADDVGPVEANPRGARSSTWAADSSTYSMAFTATGFHEFHIPVDATSTTVTVKAYKDASYAGTAPKLEVLIGSTSQGTDSMSVGTEEEEVLSVNFTPSAAGWARVRLHSYATAGTVYFDTLTVA